MSKTRVMNVRDPAYVSLPDSEKQYIGRAGRGEDGYFGNSHPVGWCQQCERIHGRGEAVTAFKNEFLNYRLAADTDYVRRVLALKGKTLGCFCAPRSCHGDVIAEWVDAQP